MGNADLIDGMYRAFSAHDADQLAELMHPDVELHLVSSPQPIVGREAAREWYREAFHSRLRFQADAAGRQLEDGSYLLQGRVSWFGPGGGSDRSSSWVVTFRDGLVASIRSVDLQPD
ncbi:MAG: nuclear transport factor 2 family protein [Gaiellales bacterium]